jgi:hypothetical protein
MAANPVPPVSKPSDDDAVLIRRRRNRNIAVLVVLLALSALFYAIALVKLAKPGVAG